MAETFYELQASNAEVDNKFKEATFCLVLCAVENGKEYMWLLERILAVSQLCIRK